MDGFMFGGPNGPSFPFGFFLLRPGNTQQVEEREPPMRVRVAMDYLRLLTHKTSDGAVPHGVGAELIEGQDLVPAEIAAQTAACELLRNYFHGDLTPDVWEERLDTKRELGNGPGKLISCFLCQSRNSVDAHCVMCKGSGILLVYPSSSSNGE